MLLVKRDKSDAKDKRRACVEKAEDPRCKAAGPLPIVALFGDSARDFVELYGAEMNEKGRALMRERAGKGFFVLPNPMYGQWQKDYR